MSSPRPGTSNHQYAIGEAHDVNFVLADADGFDEHLALARRVEQQRHLRCGPRKAAKKTACGHRADENARIAGVALHADAIAQNRAACIRTGGIHSDHADTFLLVAVIRGQPIDERALAGARRAGDAGEIRLPGVGKSWRRSSSASAGMVFDGRNCARYSAHVTGPDLGSPVCHRNAYQEASPCSQPEAHEAWLYYFAPHHLRASCRSMPRVRRRPAATGQLNLKAHLSLRAIQRYRK